MANKKELEEAWKFFQEKGEKQVKDLLEYYYPNDLEKQKKLFFALYECTEFADKKTGAIDGEKAVNIFKKHGVEEVLIKEIIKTLIRESEEPYGS